MAERWLVIDDSSTIQRVIKLAFQGYDVHITEADSCQDAAREILSGQPALIIADAALGGVQGVQDFLALKAQAPQAPFVILEGSYDNIDETQFRSAGFRHFLKKPFDGSQLLSITRQALGRALPYRGEAAVAAAAGAPQPAASPMATMPPPPPPVRGLRQAEGGSSFPPEHTSTGFDLGLNENRSMASAPAAAADHRAMAMTQITPPESRGVAGVDRHLAQTIVTPSRQAMSFSLEDDEPMPQPVLAVTRTEETWKGRGESSWDGGRKAEPEPSAGWDGPRPAGSHLGNLLEPMLQEEMEKLVRIAVEDYCRKNFAGIARELIQRELDRLTQDRSRLLMD